MRVFVIWKLFVRTHRMVLTVTSGIRLNRLSDFVQRNQLRFCVFVMAFLRFVCAWILIEHIVRYRGIFWLILFLTLPSTLSARCGNVVYSHGAWFQGKITRWIAHPYGSILPATYMSWCTVRSSWFGRIPRALQCKLTVDVDLYERHQSALCRNHYYFPGGMSLVMRRRRDCPTAHFYACLCKKINALAYSIFVQILCGSLRTLIASSHLFLYGLRWIRQLSSLAW